MTWLLFAVIVRAENLDRVYARRLSRARAGQVAPLVAEFEQVRELRLACKLEVRERRFPLSCFAVLRREDSWNLRSPAERARVLSRLETRCERATTALVLPPSTADLSPLSDACRKRVLEGREIRAYREEEGIKTNEPWSGS